MIKNIGKMEVEDDVTFAKGTIEWWEAERNRSINLFAVVKALKKLILPSLDRS